MSTIDINIVKFTEGPLKRHWGVMADYWSEHALYDANGEFIISWHREHEMMAEDAVNNGTGEPTSFGRWWKENKFEVLRTSEFTFKMMETMVAVGNKYKHLKTLLMGVDNISRHARESIEEFKNPKPQPEPVANPDWDFILNL